MKVVLRMITFFVEDRKMSRSTGFNQHFGGNVNISFYPNCQYFGQILGFFMKVKPKICLTLESVVFAGCQIVEEGCVSHS